MEQQQHSHATSSSDASLTFEDSNSMQRSNGTTSFIGKITDDWATPILADGKLLSLGRRGTLTVLDAGTGENLGRLSVESVVCSSPALANGQLYVRTNNGIRRYDLSR